MDNLFNDNEKQVLEDAKNQLIALVEDLANRLYKAGHIKSMIQPFVYETKTVLPPIPPYS